MDKRIPCKLWSLCTLFCTGSCVLLLQPWEVVRVGGWSGNQGIDNAVHHDHLSLLSTLLETWVFFKSGFTQKRLFRRFAGRPSWNQLIFELFRSKSLDSCPKLVQMTRKRPGRSWSSRHMSESSRHNDRSGLSLPKSGLIGTSRI